MVINYINLIGRKVIKIRKKTTKEFIKEVKEKGNNEYEVLERYVNCDTKIKLKHIKCGHEYYVKPKDFTSGCRCPNCNSKKKKNTKIFKEEVYNLVENEYTVIGNYINKETPIEMKHNKCGNTFIMRPHNFLQGQRCSLCYGTPKKTTEQFKKEVYDLVKDEYEVLGEYVNNKVKIKFKHNTCNHVFEMRPNDFLSNNNRCPKCYKNRSHYEDEIYSYIKGKYNYKLDLNKIFKVDKKKYELDIYIEELNIGIEINGIYWHSNKNKDKYYHYNKYKFFNKLGIKVYTIYEDEYLYNPKLVYKNIDRLLMNKKLDFEILNKKYITFREVTHIEKIDKYISTSFMESNKKYYYILNKTHIIGILCFNRKKKDNYKICRLFEFGNFNIFSNSNNTLLVLNRIETIFKCKILLKVYEDTNLSNINSLDIYKCYKVDKLYIDNGFLNNSSLYYRTNIKTNIAYYTSRKIYYKIP